MRELLQVEEYIVGEKLRLSHIDNHMNEERFADLRAAVGEFVATLKDERLKETFEKCFFNTLYTTTFFEEDGSVFIITGDIPAMWLRDSSAQVMQYLGFAEKCGSVRDLIKGLLKKQFTYILHDPYANAFNREPNGNGHIYDLDKQSPLVWERKFELDSLCYPLWLLVRYYEKTQDASCLNPLFLQAFDTIMQVFKTEQRHAESSPYYHEMPTHIEKYWCGKGTPVANCGLVWSGYRPSDDKCAYGYYIPGNMFIVSVLTKLAPIFMQELKDFNRAQACENLICEIQTALQRLAVVEADGKPVYALETDGLGNYNLMDDANIPSLLSMPYYEYPYIDKQIYQNTRQRILSFKNPYYFEGKVLKGVGSPHTPKNRVWPLSLIIRALTSTDRAEIIENTKMILNSTGGTGYIHEGVDKDDDTIYSRAWFAWANSLFAYMVIEKQEILANCPQFI